MDMKIRVIAPAERLYCYDQSVQIEEQTGCVGHICGDMGISGCDFQFIWKDRYDNLQTQEFKDEFDKIINDLRFKEEYGGILKDRCSLVRFCHNHPDGADSIGRQEYCFRADTAKYSYFLRLDALEGTYDFYVYCYLREYLGRHMKQAEKGIRFITTDYKECFRIADGDKIHIIRPDGRDSYQTCRYVDENHMEIGSGAGGHMLHIRQFAKHMEEERSIVIPLRSSLPAQCYCVLSGSGEIVIVKKGETGYYPTEKYARNREEAREIVDECNKAGGVTKSQEAAMLAGSMFGWDTPAADPKNYNEQGLPIKPRHNDRFDSR